MKKINNKSAFQRVDIQVSLFTAVVAVLSCFIISVMYFRVTHYDMIRSLEDRVHSIRDYVVSSVDKETFTNINRPEDMNTALYQQAHSVFRKAQDVTGVMYLYSAKQNAEGKLVYVVDCIDPSEDDFRSPGDPIEEEIIPEMERALNGEEVMPRTIKSTDWGKIYIAYLPVYVDNQITGVIGIEFEATHQYNTYHFLMTASPLAALFICTLCALIANHLFKRISNPLYKDMYNTDYLTNLKSRNAFDIDLKNLGAARTYEGIGFYVIDLNYLKKVNDTLGHEAGDIYLQAAAHSFRETAGQNVTIYRTGGDEFVLISTGNTLEQMEQLAKELVIHFEKSKPQWDIDLSFSIGYALYDSTVDSNLTDIYKRADARMYEKKRAHHAKYS